MQPSPIVKRSIAFNGQRTSISLEDAFWNTLKDIAYERRIPLSQLVARIDANRRQFANLSSGIRLFVLEFYKERVAELEQQEKPVQRRKRRSPRTERV
jgi:predicted DNA-binding ribbon-helix-helix protein